jgi:hypothetical protein
MPLDHDPSEPGRRTTAPPLVVAGVTFLCYHAGVLRYQWRSEDGRIIVARNAGNATTYRASVDGKPIASSRPCADGFGTPKAKRFMTQDAAMRAAVKAAQS